MAAKKPTRRKDKFWHRENFIGETRPVLKKTAPGRRTPKAGAQYETSLSFATASRSAVTPRRP